MWNSFSNHPDPHGFKAKGRPDLFEQFKKENHVLRWRIHRQGKGRPPYHDHGRTYQIKYHERTRQIHVFHEYVGFQKERWIDICMATLEWARENNKLAEIYDGSHSWYYYSEDGTGTAVIIIHDPDIHVKIP